MTAPPTTKTGRSDPTTCRTCAAKALPKTFYQCPNGHEWWAPNPGPQTRFLRCSAHEVLYGGAAGGGKSAALIMLPLRWEPHPQYRGLILRRETPQLVDLIDLSRRWYSGFDGAHGKWVGGGYLWTFKAGGKLLLNHCATEKDAFAYQGREFQTISFDELTHFTWPQYQELKSRVRASAPGLPRYLRATSNPGGDGHEWVFKRWGAWLDPKFEAAGLPRKRTCLTTGVELPPLDGGVIAWVEKDGDDERYHLTKPANYDPAVHASRTFIPASLADNPALVANDPGYARNLQDLDPVRRAQLQGGNWLVKPAKGLYFKRAWFKLLESAPAGLTCVRYWDRASSVGEGADYTAGLKLGSYGNGRFVILDVVRLRGTPGEIERTIRNTAILDGKQCLQVLERDPGSAGLVEMASLAKHLAGQNFTFLRPTGDKVTRAGPVSSQCEALNLDIVARNWTEPLVQELEGFPESAHDDQVDALSGAFHVLTVVAASGRVPKNDGAIADTGAGF